MKVTNSAVDYGISFFTHKFFNSIQNIGSLADRFVVNVSQIWLTITIDHSHEYTEKDQIWYRFLQHARKKYIKHVPSIDYFHVLFFVFQVSAVEYLCGVKIFSRKFFKTLRNTSRRLLLKYDSKWNTIDTLIFLKLFFSDENLVYLLKEAF